MPADRGPVGRRKACLRAQLTRERQLAAREERERIDGTIAERLVGLAAYARASLVLCYLSFGSEVDTWEVVQHAWDEGKVVALPRAVGRSRLEWYRVDSLDGLERSPLGMLEPAADETTRVAPADMEGALAVVPGLAFDRRGYRLGYGGGYYDAFLAGFSGTSVGLCRDGQLMDDLAAEGVLEPHDLPVDIVVSEGGVHLSDGCVSDALRADIARDGRVIYEEV